MEQQLICIGIFGFIILNFSFAWVEHDFAALSPVTDKYAQFSI